MKGAALAVVATLLVVWIVGAIVWVKSGRGARSMTLGLEWPSDLFQGPPEVVHDPRIRQVQINALRAGALRGPRSANAGDA